MLTSINPLGERARGQKFSNTVAWYLVGSALGGTALGGLSGLAGAPLPDGRWKPITVGGIAVVAVAMELLGRTPPSMHRQVNEDWLGRYRGWVYGLGFGAQLGFGLVTIVPSASIYLIVAITFLSGSPAFGALIGGVFGLSRASAILLAVPARDPVSLRAMMRRLQDWLSPARVAVVVAQVAVGAAALMVVM